MAHLPGVLQALLDWHLDVVTIPGWHTRGSATFNPHGVILHHDASSVQSGEWGALKIIVNGRPGIPGPLSQFQLARTGRVALVACGRANHAGVGSWPGIGGNSTCWGIEAANNGVGEPWPDVQVAAYTTLVRALADFSAFDLLNLSPLHREWAPRRKTDAHGLDAPALRANAVALTMPGTEIIPPIPEEDSMIFTAGLGPHYGIYAAYDSGGRNRSRHLDSTQLVAGLESAGKERVCPLGEQDPDSFFGQFPPEYGNATADYDENGQRRPIST